ncbi:MAG TPA: transporter substrate-binding domain-containing protein [Burkholderiaceae bacterium]|jgi:polar amino acid transport system substrate-binding protein
MGQVGSARKISPIDQQRRRALRVALATGGALCVPDASWAMPAAGKTLNVGFVVDMVPFVINRNEGIFLDLMREVLKRLGYGFKVYDFPSRQFDFDPLHEFAGLDLFVGTPQTHRADYAYARIYDFSNVAVSLSESHLKIDSVNDLRGKDIVAFNNASDHLKEPFHTLYVNELSKGKRYHEVESQRAQFEMLTTKRTQVIVLDRTMLRYYAAQFGFKNMQGLTLHEIFPQANEVYAVGKDAELVAQIGKTIAVLQRDGTLRRLLRPYE